MTKNPNIAIMLGNPILREGKKIEDNVPIEFSPQLLAFKIGAEIIEQLEEVNSGQIVSFILVDHLTSLRKLPIWNQLVTAKEKRKNVCLAKFNNSISSTYDDIIKKYNLPISKHDICILSEAVIKIQAKEFIIKNKLSTDSNMMDKTCSLTRKHYIVENEEGNISKKSTPLLKPAIQSTDNIGNLIVSCRAIMACSINHMSEKFYKLNKIRADLIINIIEEDGERCRLATLDIGSQNYKEHWRGLEPIISIMIRQDISRVYVYHQGIIENNSITKERMQLPIQAEKINQPFFFEVSTNELSKTILELITNLIA